MATGRAKLEWDQTSLIWATLANANRDPDNPETSKPYMPHDVHPYRDDKDYCEEKEPPKKLKYSSAPIRMRSLGRTRFQNSEP